jgi:hypothetical protein
MCYVTKMLYRLPCKLDSYLLLHCTLNRPVLYDLIMGGENFKKISVDSAAET